MYLHHEAKLIYLAQPRTASKSTAEALQSVGFVDNTGRVCASPSGLHHLTIGESKLDIGTEWTVFCTVRNHWDTVVSWACNLAGGLGYADASELDWSLKRIREVADNCPWIGECTLWHRHLRDANALVRFETMQGDLSRILAGGGLTMPPLPHVDEPTVSLRAGRHYSEFLNDDTANYIADRFAEEIERFGYEYEEAP